MSTSELEATVQLASAQAMLERTIDAATLVHRPGDTIRPKTADPTRSAEGALALLASRAGDLELEGTLGEGGMGIVRLGTQASLGRKVAIKTLKDDHREPGAVLKLLREAWVTGSLEHPNVLPIHDVRLDDDGLPLVVLKRIEGTDWIEIMKDPEAMDERFGQGDLLSNNLHVWMQVCRAIAFAHSRGIVHRDIKPENVRIGEFGEVYVLDWGLAVALQDDGSGRFPLVQNATEMAGTPCYMGPEMLGEDDPPRIDQRTDVYLLGAVLYEISMGRPPHIGSNALAILTSVLRSKPELDADAPEELTQIIERAMRAKPEDRFGSADEMRLAVSHFLEHRGSTALARQATTRLDALEQVLADAGDDSERRVRAYDLFGECRFGFAEALASWPDNPLAREGLRRALCQMIELELARGDARAARRFLEQLDAPDPALDERVAKGLAEQEEAERRRAEGEQLVRDLDKSVGTRTRMFLGIIFGVVWTFGPLVAHRYFLDEAKRNHLLMLVFCTSAAVLSAGLFLWARDSMTKTAINRRIATSVMVMLIAQLCLTAVGAMVGASPMHTWVMLFFAWMITAGLTAVTLDRRLLPTAFVHGIAFFVAAAHVDSLFLVMSAANVLTTINFVTIWRPKNLLDRDPDPAG